MATTIRVSKRTVKALEQLKRQQGFRSLDEVIRWLLLERRRMLARRFFGVDEGKISAFTEADRGEDRTA